MLEPQFLKTTQTESYMYIKYLMHISGQLHIVLSGKCLHRPDYISIIFYWFLCMCRSCWLHSEIEFYRSETGFGIFEYQILHRRHTFSYANAAERISSKYKQNNHKPAINTGMCFPRQVLCFHFLLYTVKDFILLSLGESLQLCYRTVSNPSAIIPASSRISTPIYQHRRRWKYNEHELFFIKLLLVSFHLSVMLLRFCTAVCFLFTPCTYCLVYFIAFHRIDWLSYHLKITTCSSCASNQNRFTTFHRSTSTPTNCV